MSDQGIQIPEGTIVNGQPFVKYQELQKRIAELEAMLPIPSPREMLGVYKDENQIPDWIAPWKWGE